MKKNVFIHFFALFFHSAIGTYANDATDSISINSSLCQDTLCLTVASNKPKYQLSFLMQGLNICIKDSNLNTIISLQLPNAREVKDAIRHHPNEVKAMHKLAGDEIRPDLGPLVSELNKVETIANDNIGNKIDCFHNINIDKGRGMLVFSIYLPHAKVHPDNVLFIEITSNVSNMQKEFSGKHLSNENRRPLGGLGHAPNTMNDINRRIYYKKKLIIKPCQF